MPDAKSRRIPLALLAVTAVILLAAGPARAAVITFDGLADSTVVGSAYPGVTFSNATALTAGISLNEFEFPPRSGDLVAVDDGGPMRIDFASPLASVGGYFTYLAPLTLRAYSVTDALLGTASSSFTANLLLSGDFGSLPNEFLGVATGGIAYVVVTGNTAGGSFTLDDLTYEARSVPEPAVLGLLVTGLLGVLARRRR